MGQYFKIVNTVKKQYIDASKFTENNKVSGILLGDHAIAVAMLVCNLDQVRDGWGNVNHTYGQLAGSWCGDPIYVVGDEQTEPDAFSIKTSTEVNPGRNLYWMAKEEFEDISYRSIAMLCQGRKNIAQEMVERAVNSPNSEMHLVNLGNVVFLVGSDSLAQALEEGFGNDWVARYKQTWRNRH